MIHTKYIYAACAAIALLSSNYSLQAMRRPAYGRAVPIAFDAKTNQWNVLLGHDIKTGKWNDFGFPLKQGCKANVSAQNALKEQTFGQYDIKIQGAPWRINDTTGDYFHFVPVKYISGQDLFATARPGNKYKDNFSWIPADELLTKSIVTRPHAKGQKQPEVSRGFHDFFKDKWPSVKQQLSKRPASPTRSSSPSPKRQRVTHADSWGKANFSNAIYFYEKTKPYYEFTNFQTGYPITINGIIWPTTEHYYQGMKFNNNPGLQNQIRKQPTARGAFDLAQKNSGYVRNDWKTVSLGKMLEAVREKFSQHPDLKKMLLKTGNAILVEDAGKNDSFFGSGADYKGSNHLGQILMRVRAELQGHADKNNPYTSHDPSFYQQTGYQHKL